MTALAPALQAFFTDRLITQRNSSPQTIAAYRDTFRLLLRFAHEQTGKQPFELDIDDLDAPLIGAFLKHLEEDRGNSPRTRNARLGAIHSFYRFAALEHPEHAAHDRAGDGDPDQAPRAQHRQLPRSRRDQGAARRARPRHLARPPRPRAAGAHDPDRRARLRARRPARRRCPPRHRRPHPGHGQGPQEARHDPDRRDRRDPARDGSPNAAASPTTRCSRPAKDDRSAATRSACWSPSTPPPRPPAARR